MIDHYTQIRNELVSLWEILRKSRTDSNEIKHKISNISAIALHIGGKVRADAEHLEREIDQFLKGALDKQAIDQMFRNALKLEQETREL